MALRDVIVEIATEKREFPLGTVSTTFLFELFDNTDRKISELETAGGGVRFPQVQEGVGYEVRVTANGVTVKQRFNIDYTTTMLDVPVSITVSF